jgi:hypothetical protein
MIPSHQQARTLDRRSERISDGRNPPVKTQQEKRIQGGRSAPEDCCNKLIGFLDVQRAPRVDVLSEHPDSA